MIIGAIKADNMEKAVSLLEWAEHQPEQLSVESYNVVMKAYIDRGEAKKAFALFKRMKRMNSQTCDIALSVAIRNSDISTALTVFRYIMKEFPTSITTVAYNSLISACMHTEMLPLGWEIFQQMRAKSYAPSTKTAEHLTRMFAQQRDWEGVVTVSKLLPLCIKWSRRAQLHYTIIRALFETARYEEARKHLMYIPALRKHSWVLKHLPEYPHVADHAVDIAVELSKNQVIDFRAAEVARELLEELIRRGRVEEIVSYIDVNPKALRVVVKLLRKHCYWLKVVSILDEQGPRLSLGDYVVSLAGYGQKARARQLLEEHADSLDERDVSAANVLLRVSKSSVSR